MIRRVIKQGMQTLGFVLVPLWLCTSIAFAADAQSDERMKTLEEQLSKLQSTISGLQDVITKQNQEIQAIKVQAPSSSERVQLAPAPVSNVDYKDEFKSAMKEQYPWMTDLKQGGDLRLRYEAADSNHCNLAASDGLSCSRSRNRFRIRLRWGLEKKLSEEFRVGFRFATSDPVSGSPLLSDPTSTNTTMSNYFAYKSVFFDQAYAIYTPNFFKELGPMESVEIGGGKWKNPFEKYSSNMVWDRDVTPEGLYEKTSIRLWSTEMTSLKLDVTGGQMILNEATGENQDAQLFAVQTGLDFATYRFGKNPVESRTGFSFYGYSNYQRTAGPLNLAKGNTEDPTGAATRTEKMNIFDLYQELKFYPFDKPMTFWGEYAVNMSPDHFYTLANKPTGIDARDSNGFGIGVVLGEAKKKGQWETFLNYRYLGANSVAGAFTDSEWGGTNLKGFNFGLGYALTDFLTLNWNNYVMEPIESFNSTIASSDRPDQRIYKSVFDIQWKF